MRDIEGMAGHPVGKPGRRCDLRSAAGTDLEARGDRGLPALRGGRRRPRPLRAVGSRRGRARRSPARRTAPATVHQLGTPNRSSGPAGDLGRGTAQPSGTSPRRGFGLFCRLGFVSAEHRQERELVTPPRFRSLVRRSTVRAASPGRQPGKRFGHEQRRMDVAPARDCRRVPDLLGRALDGLGDDRAINRDLSPPVWDPWVGLASPASCSAACRASNATIVAVQVRMSLALTRRCRGSRRYAFTSSDWIA